MQHIDRRNLFKLAGAGTALAAGAALTSGATPPGRGPAGSYGDEALTFRATLGLPEPPLPSYATYVVEGAIDLAGGSGLVTSRVLAGHPGAASAIGLPGLGRIVRIIGAEVQGGQVRLRGLIEDRSQLQTGEHAQVELLVDRASGVVQAPFLGRTVALKIG